MRHLVLSDLHANSEALDAVLADAAGRYDSVLCLGDLVGYGAAPNEVLERVRSLPACHVIRGNHDRAVCDDADSPGFNAAAWEAVEWTRSVLSGDHREWLRALPTGPLAVDGLCLSHGSPHDEDSYVFGPTEARGACEQSDERVVLCGHTHLPVWFRVDDERVEGGFVRGAPEIDFADEARWLFNPGSVGQPRDGRPMAAYALIDTGQRTFCFRRTAYAVARAQARIREAGLPAPLADRLEIGA